MEYLSTKNIIHRDIKPENFLLTDNFTLRVKSVRTELFFLKNIVSRELIKFCDKNSIKYDKNFITNTDHLDSTFRIDNKELNLQKIQEKKKNSIIIKNNTNNDENNNKKRDFKDIILNIIKKENIINDKNDKIIEKQNKKDEIKKSTSYKEFEINDEIL